MTSVAKSDNVMVMINSKNLNIRTSLNRCEILGEYKDSDNGFKFLNKLVKINK